MIKYLQLPFQFNVELLQAEVMDITANAWKKHYQVLHYEGDWSAIPLRSSNGTADNIFTGHSVDQTFADTIFLNSCPYIITVLDAFKCELKSVRLMKLNAGAVIKEHRDAELNYENGEARFHVPVVTHEDVEFYLEDERIKMREGECWYLNFNLPHRILNKSEVNRVHLVIDAIVNDWVKELFAQPGLLKKEEAERKAVYNEETKKQMIKLYRQMNTETGNRMADELEQTLQSKNI